MRRVLQPLLDEAGARLLRPDAAAGREPGGLFSCLANPLAPHASGAAAAVPLLPTSHGTFLGGCGGGGRRGAQAWGAGVYACVCWMWARVRVRECVCVGGGGFRAWERRGLCALPFMLSITHPSPLPRPPARPPATSCVRHAPCPCRTYEHAAVQCLVNQLLVASFYGSRLVAGCVVLWSGLPLWSTLGPRDTSALVTLAGRALVPAARAAQRVRWGALGVGASSGA